MNYKNILSFSILLLVLLVSCTDSKTDSKASKIKITDSSSQSLPKKDFEIVSIEKGNFTTRELSRKKQPIDSAISAYFQIALNVKNNTANKMNSCNYWDSRIFIQFQDEKEPKIANLNLYTALYGERLHKDITITSKYPPAMDVNVSDLWLPNTIRTFYFSIWTLRKYFERTPETVNFEFRYKIKGVDGEYENSESFNILESWKQFQIELGLR